MQRIAIIDYNMGNSRSVQKAIEFVSPNDEVLLTNDKTYIENSDRVVFPGQGAIGGCMKVLNELGLTESIKQAANEKPLLGICLGLQMLFDWSEENGGTNGLSIFEGTVNHFQNNSLKVPHMGWNTVRQTREHQLWKGINDNARFYSVHSYYANPSADVEVGSTNYGIDFCSAAARGNIFAVQFHPEKSQRDGLKLLENFVNWQVN
ncbi:MAG: imidazole glycerol phosphate synthase subunit HisH [Gammaproteobacteria bacterium]